MDFSAEGILARMKGALKNEDTKMEGSFSMDNLQAVAEELARLDAMRIVPLMNTLTQKDLAEATGIRPSTINEWYHEIVPRLNVDHIDKICEALDCSITDLLEYIPNERKTTGKYLIIEEHGNRKQKSNNE